MVICIRMWKVLDNRYSQKAKVIEKYDNEHDFGFNIAEPKEWRRYLLFHRINGMPLPRKTADGHPVAYQVYMWGGQKGISGKNKGYHVFYPGVNDQGERLPAAFYGRIDIPIKYWGEKNGV